jgi:hypothetical protein
MSNNKRHGFATEININGIVVAVVAETLEDLANVAANFDIPELILEKVHTVEVCAICPVSSLKIGKDFKESIRSKANDSIELSTIDATYRVDYPLPTHDQGFSWLQCHLFTGLVTEWDEMNMYFISPSIEKRARAIELVELFNKITISVDKSVLLKEFLNDEIFMADFYEIECKSAIEYTSMGNQPRADVNQLITMKSHLNIPSELLKLLES